MLKIKKNHKYGLNIGSRKIINLNGCTKYLFKINLEAKILKTKSKKDKIYNLYPNLYK